MAEVNVRNPLPRTIYQMIESLPNFDNCASTFGENSSIIKVGRKRKVRKLNRDVQNSSERKSLCNWDSIKHLIVTMLLSLLKIAVSKISSCGHSLARALRPQVEIDEEQRMIKSCKTRKIRLLQKSMQRLQLHRFMRLPAKVKRKLAAARQNKTSKYSTDVYLGAELHSTVPSAIKNDGLYIGTKLGGKDGIFEFGQIDSGCNLEAVINEQLSHQLLAKGLATPAAHSSCIQILDVQGNPMEQTAKPLNIMLTVAGVSREVECRVVKSPSRLLLGLPFLRRARLLLDFSMDEPRVLTSLLPETRDSLLDECAVTNSPKILAAKKWSSMQAKTGKRDGTYSISSEDLFDTSFNVPDQIVRCKNGLVNLVIKNQMENDVELLPDKPICFLKPLSEGYIVGKLTAEEIDRAGKTHEISNETEVLSSELNPELNGSEEFLRPDFTYPPESRPDWESDIKKSKKVPDDMKSSVINLLKNYESIISTSEYDIGKLADSFNFKYDLKTTGPPLKMKPYRLDPIRAAQMQQMILELERIGILKRSEDSPWGSPVFIVPKSDSRCRLTFDFRSLNHVTLDSSYPIPHISSLFETIGLSKPKYYSIVDLRSGYYNVELSEESQKKTAIVTPFGCFHNLRLSFGLKAAGSVFQSVIHRILEPLPKEKDEYCLSYLDDIIIFSKTKEDHLRHLKNVFDCIKTSGIKVVPSKMHLFQEQIELLGREINSSGINATDKYCKKILELEPPVNKRQLQRFLGMTNWLHSFIFKYSDKCKPLTELLRKDVPYQWGDFQQLAFETLKKDIAQQTKIYFPDYNDPIYVSADASDIAAAGFCYQIRSYSKEEIVEIHDRLGKGEKLNNLPKPKKQLTHPVLSKAGKNTPPPFALGTSSVFHPPDSEQAKKGIFNYFDPIHELTGNQEKYHIVLPLGFTSRTFNKQQSNWIILEKETFSICAAMKAFYSLLFPAPKVYILSDSATTLWCLKSRKSNNNKISRWAAFLFSLPFKIICTHAKGSKQSVSDFLSRADMPLIMKVDDFDPKKAHQIKSPFPIFSVITKDDLQKVVDDPNFSAKYLNSDLGVETSAKNPCGVSALKEVTLKFLGTRIDQALVNSVKHSTISLAQRKCPYFSTIIARLEKGEINKKYSLNNNGLLYRISPENEGYDRIVIPTSILGRLLCYFHVDNHQGYISLFKTCSGIYWSPTLRESCRKLTRSCYLCQINKPSFLVNEALATKSYFPCRKFSLWSVDICSALSTPTKRNAGGYINFIEYYTSYCVILPLKNLTADHVCELMETNIISNFGPPVAILSDNGSNLLTSNQVSKLLKFYQIKPILSSSYSAKSHGKVEVKHAEVTTLLRILTQQLELPWNRLCSLVQYAVNSRPSKVLEYKTPYFFMFGVDIPNRVAPYTERNFVDYRQAKLEFKNNLKLCNQIMDDYAQKRDKINESKGGKFSNLKGKFIYARDFSNRVHKKIKNLYIKMPELVTQDFGQAVLTKTYSGIFKRRHKDNVKVLNERPRELYENLPYEIKEKIGGTTSFKQLEELMEKGEIPSLYVSDIKDAQKKFTRSDAKKMKEQGQAEEAENILEDKAEVLSYDPVDSSSSDEDTEDEDENLDQIEPKARAKNQKRVRFAI